MLIQDHLVLSPKIDYTNLEFTTRPGYALILIALQRVLVVFYVLVVF